MPGNLKIPRPKYSFTPKGPQTLDFSQETQRLAHDLDPIARFLIWRTGLSPLYLKLGQGVRPSTAPSFRLPEKMAQKMLPTVFPLNFLAISHLHSTRLVDLDLKSAQKPIKGELLATKST